MTTTLATLLGPRPVTAFLRDDWGRAARHVPGALGESHRDLLDLPAFERLIGTLHRAHDGWLHLAAGGRRPVPAGYADADGLLDLTAVRAAFAAGDTLYLTKAHRIWPPLTSLCRRVGADLRDGGIRLREPISAHVFLTPPGAQGFAPHRDAHASIVLQLAGHKTWQLSPDHRAAGEPRTPGPAAFTTTPQEVTLTAGDVLYLPEWWVHAARTSDEHSLHVTLRAFPLRWSDLLAAALPALTTLDDPVTTPTRPGSRPPQSFQSGSSPPISTSSNSSSSGSSRSSSPSSGPPSPGSPPPVPFPTVAFPSGSSPSGPPPPGSPPSVPSPPSSSPPGSSPAGSSPSSSLPPSSPDISHPPTFADISEMADFSGDTAEMADGLAADGPAADMTNGLAAEMADGLVAGSADGLVAELAARLASPDLRAALAAPVAQALRRFDVPPGALPGDGLTAVLRAPAITAGSVLRRAEGAVCAVSGGDPAELAFPGGTLRGPAALGPLFGRLATDDEVTAAKLEPDAPPGTDLLALLRRLIAAGVFTVDSR